MTSFELSFQVGFFVGVGVGFLAPLVLFHHGGRVGRIGGSLSFKQEAERELHVINSYLNHIKENITNSV